MRKIFKVSDVKSTYFIRQTAILTPLRRHIPATSHFVKFDYKPDKNENIHKVLTSSKIDRLFLKKVVSSA